MPDPASKANLDLLLLKKINRLEEKRHLRPSSPPALIKPRLNLRLGWKAKLAQWGTKLWQISKKIVKIFHKGKIS